MEIRRRDGNVCVICGCGKKENAEWNLNVHHIDEDKWNLSPFNLITLCDVCHNDKNTHGNELMRHILSMIAHKHEMNLIQNRQQEEPPKKAKWDYAYWEKLRASPR